jgi:hypothetical protein
MVGKMVREESAGSKPSDAPSPTLIWHLRALSKGHRIRHPQHFERGENMRMDRKAMLEAWFWRWSDSRLRCASREVQRGFPRAGSTGACWKSPSMARFSMMSIS